jgi:prepilin-type N-terminal cleavage/methylation domain-containing protein/prepilin-type processing-associated H-X9-DG protein
MTYLPTRKGPAAFTLMELLVVIAIIAILASLLLVSIAKGKSTARSAHCKSNLRQQGLALMSYVLDNSVYPLETGPGYVAEFESLKWGKDLWHLNFWYFQLNTVLRGENQNHPDRIFAHNYVFRCPSDRLRESPYPHWHESAYGYNTWGIRSSAPGSSTQNYGLGGNWLTGTLFPTKESEVVNPANMIAIGDGFRGTSNGRIDRDIIEVARDSFAQPLQPGQRDVGTERARKRHNGIANVLFADGHVEGLRLQALFLDKTDTALRRWNKDNEPHADRVQ